MNYMLIGALMLLNASACLTVPASPAPPAHVIFDSVDFKDVLRWTPSANSSDVRYDVQWKIYGVAEWLDVAKCQGIREPSCDLSGVTSNPREWYYARVRASSPSPSSKWVLSLRFSPRLDTKISAPQLGLNVSEQGIVVHVATPQALTRKLQSSRLHNTLIYNIYLLNQAGQEEVFKLRCCSGSLLVSKVKHKTKYCFQSQSVLQMLGRDSARGPAKCITTL
nr:interleukin-20 receptor subunit alpha-like [Nerophis lumbriciformis]